MSNLQLTPADHFVSAVLVFLLYASITYQLKSSYTV